MDAPILEICSDNIETDTLRNFHVKIVKIETDCGTSFDWNSALASDDDYPRKYQLDSDLTKPTWRWCLITS